MITQRFRSFVWVAGAATAATVLYIVSSEVAGERARLEEVDRQIVKAERDIRQLQTELGTRASMRQLERWNGEVLALSAPSAKQFLQSEAALRLVDGSALPEDGFAPPPVMVAALGVAQAPQGDVNVPVKKAEPLMPKAPVGKVATAKTVAAKAEPKAKPERLAQLDRKLVDRRTLSEIMRAAEVEKTVKGKPAQ